MIRYGWFDVPIGGDVSKYTYSADQMRDLWRSIYTNGIIPNVRQTDNSKIVPETQLGNSLAAIVGQGLSIRINLGIAMLDGAYFIIDEEPINVPVTAGQINDIVLRLDLTGADVVFGIFSKQRSAGTIEAGLTRAGGIYELGLHSVNVPVGADQISASMITDYRLNLNPGPDGKPCCGLVGSLLQPDIDEWYTRARTGMDVFMNTGKEAFDEWFQTLQDTLSGDVAANLYALITEHTMNHDIHVTAEEKASWTQRLYSITLSSSGWALSSIDEVSLNGMYIQQIIGVTFTVGQKVDIAIPPNLMNSIPAGITTANVNGTVYAVTEFPPDMEVTAQITVTNVTEGAIA